MKKILAAIAAVLALASCNSHDAGQVKRTDSTTVTVQNVPAASERENLVNALRKLRQQLEDSSGAQFADAFQFPVAESDFFPYIEDDGFNARYSKDGSKMSRALFSAYFPQIAETVQLSEFRELFRQIAPERLLKEDSVHQASSQYNEPCRQYYLIHRRGNEIELNYGSDHNDAYRAAEDAEETICEWATIWMFRLEGNTLRFVKMFQAG